MTVIQHMTQWALVVLGVVAMVTQHHDQASVLMVGSILYGAIVDREVKP